MIRTDDGYEITVSRHAAQAAVRRHPELAGRREQDGTYWVENRALDALRAGRKACNQPRWATRVWSNGFTHRRKARHEGVIRYIWDEQRTFVMLAVRLSNPNVWHIVTVMTPDANTASPADLPLTYRTLPGRGMT